MSHHFSIIFNFPPSLLGQPASLTSEVEPLCYSSGTSCGANSTSRFGSTEAADCKCNKGFTGRDGGPCNACVPGQYKDYYGTKMVNGSDCKPCVAGKYSPTHAQIDCISCVNGKYSAMGASSSSLCIHCAPGKYSTSAALGCTSCAAGKYSNTSGNAAESDCQPCTAGKYSALAGSNSSASCLPCSANSNSPASSDNVSDCICDAGFAGADGGSCTGCVAGKFKPTRGSQECTQCAGGKFSGATEAVLESTCLSCSINTYSSSNSSYCVSCPVNHTSLLGSSSIVNCTQTESTR